eukprot:Tbor_TRINITY_DN3435_c0_g1::TRINITY_DN3435_c0_g1_i1::g.3698::m.3698/K11135/PINX1; Pin2-interacting protein X1
MSSDPNNTKWSKDESRFGVGMMKKLGWDGKSGIGLEGDGVKSHVRVTKKDNSLGIGYEGKVNDTWSQQSMGFADILKRMNSDNETKGRGKGIEKNGSSDDVLDCYKPKFHGGKSSSLYNKRQTLKTGALHSSQGKQEIMGDKRPRAQSSDSDDSDSERKSSLKSPTLNRLMSRYHLHEPRKAEGGASEVEKIVITKPQIKPPKVIDTPFFA